MGQIKAAVNLVRLTGFNYVLKGVGAVAWANNIQIVYRAHPTSGGWQSCQPNNPNSFDAFTTLDDGGTYYIHGVAGITAFEVAGINAAAGGDLSALEDLLASITPDLSLVESSPNPIQGGVVYDVLNPSQHNAFPMLFNIHKLERHYGTEAVPLSGVPTIDDTDSVRGRICILHYQDATQRDITNISGFPVSLIGPQPEAGKYNHIFIGRGTMAGRYWARVANAAAVVVTPTTGPRAISAFIKSDELNALYVVYDMDVQADTGNGFTLNNAGGITITGKALDLTEANVLKFTLSGNVDPAGAYTFTYDNALGDVRSAPDGVAAGAELAFGIVVSDEAGPTFVAAMVGDLGLNKVRFLYNEALLGSSVPTAADYLIEMMPAGTAVWSVVSGNTFALDGVNVVATIGTPISAAQDRLRFKYTGSSIKDVTGNLASQITEYVEIINMLDLGAARFKADDSNVIWVDETTTSQIAQWLDSSGSRDAANNLENNHLVIDQAVTTPAFTPNVTPAGNPVVRFGALSRGLIARNNFIHPENGFTILFPMRHNNGIADDGSIIIATDVPFSGDMNVNYIPNHRKGYQLHLAHFGVSESMDIKADNKATVPLSTFQTGTFRVLWGRHIHARETVYGLNHFKAYAPKPSKGFIPKAQIETGTVIGTSRGSGGVFLNSAGKDMVDPKIFRRALSDGEIKDEIIKFNAEQGITLSQADQDLINAMDDVQPTVSGNAVVGREAYNIITIYITGILKTTKYTANVAGMFPINGLPAGITMTAVDVKAGAIDLILSADIPAGLVLSIDHGGGIILTPKGKVLNEFVGIAVDNYVIDDSASYLVIDPIRTTPTYDNAAVLSGPDDLLPLVSLTTSGTAGRTLIRREANQYGIIAQIRDGVRGLVSKYRQKLDPSGVEDAALATWQVATNLSTLATHTENAMMLYFAFTTEPVGDGQPDEAPLKYLLARDLEWSGGGSPGVSNGDKHFYLSTRRLAIWDKTAVAYNDVVFSTVPKANRTYIGCGVVQAGQATKVYISTGADGTVLEEIIGATPVGSLNTPTANVPLIMHNRSAGGEASFQGISWYYQTDPVLHSLPEMQERLNNLAGRLQLSVDTSVLNGGT